MRSGLTMLGMVIGVAAVIAMVAVGSGANERISAQIASVGSNLIMVLSGSTNVGGLRSGSGGSPSLTLADAKAIGSELSAVRYAAALNRTGAQVVYGNQNWSTQVQGVTPEFFSIREWQPAAGRLFTPEELEDAAKVALVGQTVAENLFAGENPVGQVIRIKKVPFTVLGVLERKGQSPQGQDQDDAIVAPLTTVQQKLQGSARRGGVSVILVQARDERSVADAEAQVRDLLRQRHRIGLTEEDDFNVRNLSEMLAAAEASTRIMGVLLGSIASVSLLVGGIGIMNIMLVSVTERTREIGIRMAVGARDSDILMQFLIEAIVLAVFGGGVGVLVGVGAAVLISRFAGWSTLISPGAIFLAAGFSAAVGLFFGFYPARKASRLDPIEALRYD
ncbi:MAG: ABC transporter permease [Deltaproteobacteria bacterium]|nr:ABC transporter permease [Deltaproteobacteria bacterium]